MGGEVRGLGVCRRGGDRGADGGQAGRQRASWKDLPRQLGGGAGGRGSGAGKCRWLGWKNPAAHSLGLAVPKLQCLRASPGVTCSRSRQGDLGLCERAGARVKGAGGGGGGLQPLHRAAAAECSRGATSLLPSPPAANLGPTCPAPSEPLHRLTGVGGSRRPLGWRRW